MPLNDRLFDLLAALDDEELNSLWTGCLKCEPEREQFSRRPRDGRITLISQVWRAAHGNVVLNLRRGPHELPWKSILIDVADRLKPGVTWTAYRLADHHNEIEIETTILRLYDERLGPSWDELTPDQREKVSNGYLPPDETSLLTKLSSRVFSFYRCKSMAATIALLYAHERRRLIASFKDQ